MKQVLSIVLLLLALTVAAFGQAPEPSDTQKIEAKNEIDEGARAYRARNYYEAQLHFERAMALDLTHKNAPLFYARALHAQFKPGDESPENVARARAAVAAYQRVLEADPTIDDAYNAVVYLFRMIKDEQHEREWLTARATDEKFPAEKRSVAYTVLASKDWSCSYEVTEKPGNKLTVMRGQRAITEYVMPKDRADYARAEQCASRGLDFAEKAIALDAESEQAWSFKTNILLELVKLAHMDGSLEGALARQRQADEAQRRTSELNELNKRKREADEKRKAEALPPPPRQP